MGWEQTALHFFVCERDASWVRKGIDFSKVYPGRRNQYRKILAGGRYGFLFLLTASCLKSPVERERIEEHEDGKEALF